MLAAACKHAHVSSDFDGRRKQLKHTETLLAYHAGACLMACKAWHGPFCLVGMHLTIGNNMLTE